jgi:uncharacterized protein
MKKNVVEGIKNLLDKRAPNLRKLTISWFGGEPLLAPDIIRKIQGHCLGLLKQFTGIWFHSNMTTNGYLLGRARFEELLESKVTRYQISFDGPSEIHNRKRILPNGNGTFDQIWNNLRDISKIDKDFTIILRLHVDQENLPYFPEFISRILGGFGSDPRFKFFVRPLARLGGNNDKNLNILNGDGKKKIIESLIRDIPKDRLEGKFSGKKNEICYAAEGNSFVVRANGSINKCTVALDNPFNHIGTLDEDGHAILDNGKHGRWLRGFFSSSESELQCPLKGIENSEIPAPFQPAGPSE